MIDGNKALLQSLLLDNEFRTVGYKAVEYLERYVKKSVRAFHDAVRESAPADKAYKGPFSAICQSSGMGKTRLSLQLATQANMHIIYLCCRDNDDGYPPRTAAIAERIRTDGLQAWFWPQLLCAAIEMYRTSGLVHHDGSLRWKWLQDVVPNTDKSKDFWNSVLEKCTRSANVLDDEDIRGLVETAFDGIPGSEYFVFVFDEAAALAKEEVVTIASDRPTGERTTVSKLNRIRKALCQVGSRRNIFGLFLDTNTSISHLFPPDPKMHVTPSARKQDMTETRKLVFRPVWSLPFCNPGKTDAMPVDQFVYMVGDDTVRVSFCPATLALLSRPVFAMEVHKEFQRDRVDGDAVMPAMVDFAEKKLMHRVNWEQLRRPSPENYDDAEVAKLAILGCRLFLSTTSTLHKQLLVRQHMATCMGISKDGRDVVISYQSEPLLAEAAAQLMLKDGALVSLLETMCGMALRGVLALPLGKGEVGELVVCLALLRAFDKASRRLPAVELSSSSVSSAATAPASAPYVTVCRPIPLVEVLVELYAGSGTERGQDEVRQEVLSLMKDNALSGGVVMFNHFVKARGRIRDAMQYKALLRRGAAVVCMNGEAARDVVIPVALPTSPERHIDPWDADSYVLSTWEIQVKHWEAAFDVKDLVSSVVARCTLDRVDSGYKACLRHRSPRTDEVTGLRSSPDAIWSVPTLYSTFNTNADHSVDLGGGSIGSTHLLPSHWAADMLASLPSSVTAEILEEEETSGEPKAKQARVSTVAVMEVIGTQLCGLNNFRVFNEEERGAIQRLLTVSDDMALTREFHEELLELSAKDAQTLLEQLLPENSFVADAAAYDTAFGALTGDV